MDLIVRVAKQRNNQSLQVEFEIIRRKENERNSVKVWM